MIESVLCGWMEWGWNYVTGTRILWQYKTKLSLIPHQFSHSMASCKVPSKSPSVATLRNINDNKWCCCLHPPGRLGGLDLTTPTFLLLNFASFLCLIYTNNAWDTGIGTGAASPSLPLCRVRNTEVLLRGWLCEKAREMAVHYNRHF